MAMRKSQNGSDWQLGLVVEGVGLCFFEGFLPSSAAVLDETSLIQIATDGRLDSN
jgi:hypothetical protein